MNKAVIITIVVAVLVIIAVALYSRKKVKEAQSDVSDVATDENGTVITDETGAPITQEEAAATATLEMDTNH